ncbi:MAG: hypothetical protein HYU83_01910, partial [Chloroflexi bacterium]|nr:hypothetical protein [Chloroflexota bacterium]
MKDYYRGNANLTNYPTTPYRMYVTLGVAKQLNEWPEVFQEAMKYQPEKARQLLAEAGYPSGFKMEVIVESVADRIDELSLIKDYLAKIGVALDIQPKESGVFASISQGKTHKETIYTGAGAMHYDWESWRPGAPANVGMINNPAVNKAITEFSNYFFISDDKAFRIMRETVVYIAEQFWVVPFPSPHEYVIWQPWLKG